MILLASDIKVLIADLWGPVYIDNMPIIDIKSERITVGHNAEYLFGIEIVELLERVEGPFLISKEL